MNWNHLLSAIRLGQSERVLNPADMRTQFQRDYDRLIFSSPFRRLQDKTQVFPLPGSVFVHNRLTHSLEVASVGRSLGHMLSHKLEESGEDHLLISEIGSVVAAACLAHDMGNPPFGHSGEDAIKEFFLNGNGKKFEAELMPAQWKDLTLFDGNANAFRVLSHQFKGRRVGGFALTYTMLASVVKYPYESIAASKPKFGFFQSEKELFERVANNLGISKLSHQPLRYARHPLVFLVEAADDICYQIMDVEDAHKLKILSYDETRSLYLAFYNEKEDAAQLKYILNTLDEVTDRNEQIAYLRAGVIGRLVNECITVFLNKYNEIMLGEFNDSLIKHLSAAPASAMEKVKSVSKARIYNDPSVIEIELAGFRIISTLMDAFTDAMMQETSFGRKLIRLFPEQFHPEKDDAYCKIQSVVDYVSGMTDVYALDLYRKITGINISGL
jgi:dGTPase